MGSDRIGSRLLGRSRARSAGPLALCREGPRFDGWVLGRGWRRDRDGGGDRDGRTGTGRQRHWDRKTGTEKRRKQGQKDKEAGTGRQRETDRENEIAEERLPPQAAGPLGVRAHRQGMTGGSCPKWMLVFHRDTDGMSSGQQGSRAYVQSSEHGEDDGEHERRCNEMPPNSRPHCYCCRWCCRLRVSSALLSGMFDDDAAVVVVVVVVAVADRLLPT